MATICDPQGTRIAQQQAITSSRIHRFGGKQPGGERPPGPTDAVDTHDVEGIIIAKAVLHDHSIEADDACYPTDNDGRQRG